jgi:hypothetical protein
MENNFASFNAFLTQEYKMNPGECPKVWLKSMLSLAECLSVQEYKMDPADCPRRWAGTKANLTWTQEYRMDPGAHPEPWVLELDPIIKKQMLKARYEYLIDCAQAEIKLYNEIISKL